MNARDNALNYVERGWAPVPIPFRKKGPVLSDWQDVRVTVKNIDQYFDSTDGNVGVLLGRPSGNLVDIDLDSAEALELTCAVLLPTITFGHASSRQSHWLYVAEGSLSLKFKDPIAKERNHKETLLEIRSTGSQTVFPGSTHPSGERIEWDAEGAPVSISAKELKERVSCLAALSLLKRCQ